MLKDFDFCICFLLGICYRVFIPLEMTVGAVASKVEVVCVTGLPARTEMFVPSFYLWMGGASQKAGFW